MAKTVRVAKKEASPTYFTVPGNTADFNVERDQLDDTIFGVKYSSTQPGLMSWTLSANSMYRGHAGYNASIKTVENSTPFTNQAMTNVGGNTWQIDDLSKRIWDRSVTPTVSTGTILEIDYLFGKITFTGAVTTPTVNGNAYDTIEIGCSNSYSLTQSSDTTDTTCFRTTVAPAESNTLDDTKTDGARTIIPTLKTVSLELTGFYRPNNEFFKKVKESKELIIEIRPDRYSGAGEGSLCRGYFKPVSHNQSGDVGGAENETITFNIASSDGIDPFGWEYGSILPKALGVLLSAWQASEPVLVRYEPDSITTTDKNREGAGYVTEISLEQSVDGMSEFSITVQSTGTAITF
jgi:hypothetical protein